MEEPKPSLPPQPWACSSLSTSDKFFSLYDKMLEDWEKRNFESLVSTRSLQQAPPERCLPALPPVVEKFRSKIVFPQIISRGSVVGKKVYCSTSIHTSMLWQRNSRTQRIHSSTLFVNSFQARSGDVLDALEQSGSIPADSVIVQKVGHSLDSAQCRGLLLGLAGAAGMRLICPPLPLTLLEILLFSHQQLSSQNRATLSKEGRLWCLPLNLALATLRPFCGSLLRRCLTAVILISQMKFKKKISERRCLRYLPDLYSIVVFEKTGHHHHQKELTICSNLVQIEDPVTAEVQEVDVVAKRGCRSNGMVHSGVGDLFVEECCNACAPVVEIWSRQQEDGPSKITPASLEQNSVTEISLGLPEMSKLQLVDVGVEDAKFYPPKPSLQQHIQELSVVHTTNNVLVPQKRLRSTEHGLVARKRIHITVDKQGIEQSLPADFAHSPAIELQLELPSFSVKAGCGTVSIDEDAEAVVDAMGSPGTKCAGGGKDIDKRPKPTSVSQTSADPEPVDGLAADGFYAAGGVSTVVAVPEPADNVLCPWMKEPLDTQSKKIEDGESTDLVEGKCLERIVEWENEARPIGGIGNSGRVEKVREGQAEAHISSGDDIERGSPDSSLGRDVVVEFCGGARRLEEEGNSPLSTNSSTQSNSTGNEHQHPSPTRVVVTALDERPTEDTVLPDHSDFTTRKSCPEYPESQVGSGIESFSKTVTNTSLTSRQNIATEAASQTLEPDNLALPVVLEKPSCHKGLHEVDAEVLQNDSDSIKTHAGNEQPPGPTISENALGAVPVVAKVASASEEDDREQSSVLTGGIDVTQDDNSCTKMCPNTSPVTPALSSDSSGVPEHPFADHPTCIALRERRHSHGDQTYLDMKDLLPRPWGQLIFWHGRCKEGKPTLCVLLGKAVRQLPSQELKHFIAVTVSHIEYAELHYFKEHVKQMNIVMDLEGLGFMRLPPMNILSSIGAILNRDYAGRGGWMILLNAPVMLGFVISAIQGILFRPSYNKGVVIDSSWRGFLEGTERIMMMGSKYRPALQKHFEPSMLPVAFGGDCQCSSDEAPCKLGSEFLKLPWNRSSKA